MRLGDGSLLPIPGRQCQRQGVSDSLHSFMVDAVQAIVEGSAQDRSPSCLCRLQEEQCKHACKIVQASKV